MNGPPALRLGACSTVARGAALALALLGLFGCAAIKRAALRSVAGTLAEGGTTAAAHDDPELVAEALPFSLLLDESLLASVPRHVPLLAATCGQYTQYALGFVQAEAEAASFDEYERSVELTRRALRLALRGRGYCWRGLEVRFPGIAERLERDPAAALGAARRSDVPLLYWSAASLGAAISLGGLDHPELLIDWPLVAGLAERALALDESFDGAALHELLITVESRGEVLGGSEVRAREHFARAIELQRGRSPGPYLALALGISRSKQDRREFEALLGQALAVDPDAVPERRLATLVQQRRARVLLDHVSDLFLE
jgi:predicted anti-sigma-YlaC factor YlaD